MANLVLAVKGSATKVRATSRLLARSYGASPVGGIKLKNIRLYEVPGEPALMVQATMDLRRSFRQIKAAPVDRSDILVQGVPYKVSPRRVKALLRDMRLVGGQLEVRTGSLAQRAASAALGGDQFEQQSSQGGNWSTLRLGRRRTPLGLGFSHRTVVLRGHVGSATLAVVARALSRLVRLGVADRELALERVSNVTTRDDLRSAVKQLTAGPWREDVLCVGYGLPLDCDVRPQVLSIKLLTSGTPGAEAGQPQPLCFKGLGAIGWEVVPIGQFQVTEARGTTAAGQNEAPRPLVGKPPPRYREVAVSGDGGATYGTIGGMIPAPGDASTHYGITCEHVVRDAAGEYAPTVLFHHIDWTNRPVPVLRLAPGIGDRLDVALLGPFAHPIPNPPPRLLMPPWAQPFVNEMQRYEFFGATSGHKIDTAYIVTDEFPLHTNETVERVVLFRPGFADAGDSGSVVFQRGTSRPLGIIMVGTKVNERHLPVCLPICDVNDRLKFCVDHELA